MEKEELVKNLLDLRMNLCLFASAYERLEKIEAFEEICKTEKTYFDEQKDPYATSIYQYSCDVINDYNPESDKPWPAINNWIKMYDIDKDHVLITGLQLVIPDYVFLFDDFAKKKLFPKYWKKLRGRFYNNPRYVSYPVSYTSSFFGHNSNIELAMKNFNYINLNVLKIKKQICEDAIKSKKHPLSKLYKIKEIENSFIPKIDFLIKNNAANTSTARKRCKSKYGVEAVRTREQTRKDNQLIKEMKKGIQILQSKHSYIAKSDWQNIDGLLYFLNTGRADTIKEALNLLDQRMYAQQINSSIQELNRSVVSGINAIRSDLNYYFNELFTKLDYLSSDLKEVATQLSKNTAAIQYTSSQIDRVITSIVNHK